MTEDRKPYPTKRKRRRKRRARDLPDEARSTKMKPRRAVVGDKETWRRGR